MEPAEQQMREQMFKTMVALEKAANAATAYFEAVTPEEPEKPEPPTSDELKEMGKVIAKHHQALGLIATFGEFKDAGFGILDPRRSITYKLGMRACADCGGTGWAAQDEQCKTCKSSGYIKP